jgi:hypothetical protein
MITPESNAMRPPFTFRSRFYICASWCTMHRMSTITFDTQELVRELRTSGLPQEQAEAVVRTIVKSHEGLASKTDIERLELKLDAKFSLVDAKFDKLSWMMGILIAIAIANFAKQFF